MTKADPWDMLADIREDCAAMGIPIRDAEAGYAMGEAVANPKSAATNAQKDAKPPVHTGVLMRFPRALKAIAECSRVGTEKRGISLNDVGFWSDPLAYDRYREARARHILEEAIEGLINQDPRDKGLAHDVQCAWDALAVVECRLWAEEQEEKMRRLTDLEAQALREQEAEAFILVGDEQWR